MKKRRFKKAGSEVDQSTLLPWMDYLHGDVVDNEFAVACCYEYDRQLHVLSKTNEDVEIVPLTDEETYKTWLQIEKRFWCSLPFKGEGWESIRQSPSFPKKTWNQLSAKERAHILIGFQTSQIQPLDVRELHEVNPLDPKGISERLSALVAQEKRMRRGESALFPTEPYVEVTVTLDFSKTRNRLVQEFDKWLQLRKNKARFDAHARNPIGRMGLFKDQLKDLAVWRIYEGRGRDWEEANDFANRHRINRRPFYDARQGQTKKTPLHEASLYGEEYGFLKAKRRAIKFLKFIAALKNLEYSHELPWKWAS